MELALLCSLVFMRPQASVLSSYVAMHECRKKWSREACEIEIETKLTIT
jgi:hypothetical protein